MSCTPDSKRPAPLGCPITLTISTAARSPRQPPVEYFVELISPRFNRTLQPDIFQLFLDFRGYAGRKSVSMKSPTLSAICCLVLLVFGCSKRDEESGPEKVENLGRDSDSETAKTAAKSSNVDMAIQLMDAGDTDRALPLLQAAVAKDPGDRRAKYYLDLCEQRIAKRSNPNPQPRVHFP